MKQEKIRLELKDIGKFKEIVSRTSKNASSED